jgi:coenzyme F420-0:L-glutamate ligase/coenzyme F420-1:gamma-L-glutamate ligase
MRLEIVGLRSLPEVRPGDDLGGLIRRAARRERRRLDAATVLVVAQKVVSKAEGAVVDLGTVRPSPRARRWAAKLGRDPRLIEVILRESRRIVRAGRGVLIAETRHGMVTANAGVDQSNVAGQDTVTVLPRDPDASARRLRRALGCGAVVITDTFGRPWRIGLVNVAVGVAGLDALVDYRGRLDRAGRPLRSTIVALADELAAAAGLAMEKTAGVPVVLIRGLEWRAARGSARSLIRPAAEDLFR